MPGVDAQVTDAIGFDLQGFFPAVGGEIEVIGRHIFRGKRFVGTAIFQRDAIDIARHQAVGALEHQVLEVVRQACLVQVLISSPHIENQHGGHRGGPWHRHQGHSQAILQAMGLHPVVQAQGRDQHRIPALCHQVRSCQAKKAQ